MRLMKVGMGILLAFLILMPMGQVAAAADKDLPIDLELDFTFASKYVWRGANLTNDPVLQPSITLAYKGFSLNVWGNMDLTDINDQEFKFNEADYTLEYAHTFNKLKLAGGFIFYDFPNTDAKSTMEFYVGVGLDVLLSPTLKIYRDIDEADGWYLNLEVSHSFKFSKIASLDLGLALGWGDENFHNFNHGALQAGLGDLVFKVAVPIKINNWFSITPSAFYSTLITSELRDAQAEPDNFVLAFSFTFSF